MRRIVFAAVPLGFAVWVLAIIGAAYLLGWLR